MADECIFFRDFFIIMEKKVLWEEKLSHGLGCRKRREKVDSNLRNRGLNIGGVLTHGRRVVYGLGVVGGIQ